MHAPTAEHQAQTIHPAIRRRVIRRSLRCLNFAWIGLIPIVGAALAALAIRLHWQAMKESGEAFRARPIVIALCVGAPVASGVVFNCGFRAGLAIASLFICLMIHYIRLQFRTCSISPPINPVRSQAFCGLALAYIGLFLGFTLAGAFLLTMYDSV